MPRPLLKQPKSQTTTESLLDLSINLSQQPETYQANKMKTDRILRKTRSKEYMKALCELDAGGDVNNKKQVEKIINTIRNEFPEISISSVLLGYVSICYLGTPYEVHTLSMAGGILEHYKAGQSLPGELEKARSIAIHGGYAFIEVYIDCCRAIYPDGTVSVISC